MKVYATRATGLRRYISYVKMIDSSPLSILQTYCSSAMTKSNVKMALMKWGVLDVVTIHSRVNLTWKKRNVFQLKR